jgi:hypothetical protein
MSEAVLRLLESLRAALPPVHDQAMRFMHEGSCFDQASRAVLISPRPKIGTEAYAVVLFTGLDSNRISRYEEMHQSRIQSRFSIPDGYRRVLNSMNGASIFEIQLFGIPETMAQDPPLLSRSVRQPLDLATATQHWGSPFKPKLEQFHFGGGPYSYSENVGYFLNPNESVESRRKGGESVNLWPCIDAFLEAELARAEARFPEHEAQWEAMLKEIKPKKRRG